MRWMRRMRKTDAKAPARALLVISESCSAAALAALRPWRPAWAARDFPWPRRPPAFARSSRTRKFRRSRAGWRPKMLPRSGRSRARDTTATPTESHCPQGRLLRVFAVVPAVSGQRVHHALHDDLPDAFDRIQLEQIVEGLPVHFRAAGDERPIKDGHHGLVFEV